MDLDILMKHSESVPIVTEENLIEYDVNKEDINNMLYGVREKHFFRADSQLFSGLIRDLQDDPNCAYVTHVNELIQRNGYVPKHISALYKYTDIDIGLREVIASRIMNYFEIPTSYEMLVKVDDRNYGVLSADYVPSGKEMYTLGDFRIYTDRSVELDHNTILDRMDIVYKSKRRDNPLPHVNSSQEFKNQVHSILEDYMYGYLVRTIILGDSDFHQDNCAILFDEDKISIDQLIHFDYDGSLRTNKMNYGLTHTDLKFVATMYPHIFKKFVSKMNSLLQKYEGDKTRLESILDDDSIPKLCDENKEIEELIIDRLVKARSICNDIIRDIFISTDNFEKLA